MINDYDFIGNSGLLYFDWVFHANYNMNVKEIKLSIFTNM